MSIKKTIETCCKDLDITCKYANLDEANATILDTVKDKDLPVLLVIPYPVTDVATQSGFIESSLPFEAFLLTRYKQKTVDASSNEIEEKVIEPMRKLARELMRKINSTDMIMIGGINRVVYSPVFSSGDASLHGVQISCSIPVYDVTESSIVCNP